MDESKKEDFDPTNPDRREIGREIVDESGGLGSAIAYLYRGEMDRMTTWRQRLDQTTYLAVTLMAAILTWTFSSRDNSHYILIIGMIVVGVFLQIEARRYRGYDVWPFVVGALVVDHWNDSVIGAVIVAFVGYNYYCERTQGTISQRAAAINSVLG